MKNFKNLAKEIIPPFLYRMIKSLNPKNKIIDSYILGEEKSSIFYEDQFIKQERWKTHYTKSGYYPLWAIITDRIIHNKSNSILDIGCGSGQMALLLYDKKIPSYCGFDFSSSRIEYAKTICPEFEFVADDAFTTKLFYTYKYDAVVCLEFLEHVERDCEVIEKIKSGTRFYGTVPNYTAPAHVRIFDSVEGVKERYNKYFQDFSVTEHLVDTQGRKLYFLEGIKS